MIPVSLTWAEIFQGAMVGIMRQTSNLKAKRVKAYGLPDNHDWQIHIEGAMGELAVSKAFGVYHSGAFSFRALDVGKWQVRTAGMHNYRLILHEDDSDEDRFILVTGSNGEYRIHGWIQGALGKIAAFWQDPKGGRPAYFVPQDALTAFQPEDTV